MCFKKIKNMAKNCLKKLKNNNYSDNDFKILTKKANLRAIILSKCFQQVFILL